MHGPHSMQLVNGTSVDPAVIFEHMGLLPILTLASLIGLAQISGALFFWINVPDSVDQ